MMEELFNAIVSVVSTSPNLAIWVLVIIYGYKVFIVGSIYGLIRYIVKTFKEVKLAPVQTEFSLDGLYVIDEHALKNALKELGRSSGGETFNNKPFIGSADIAWLMTQIEKRANNGK